MDEEIEASSFILGCMGLGFLILFGFLVIGIIYRIDKYPDGKEAYCVNYYKENNYILDKCYKYEDKIKSWEGK